MVVSPTTGGRIDAPVLDANGDGTLNASDKIGSGAIYASGVQSKVGILPTPAIVTGGIFPGGSSVSGSQIYGTSGPLLEGTSLLIAFAIGGGSNGLATTLLGLAASKRRGSSLTGKRIWAFCDGRATGVTFRRSEHDRCEPRAIRSPSP